AGAGMVAGGPAPLPTLPRRGGRAGWGATCLRRGGMMHARLTVETDGETSVYDLAPDHPVTLGRSRENTIVLADEHASRAHARLQFEGGRWVLCDLESRNGTRLDGQPVSRTTPLADGQEIMIGATRMQFRLDRGDPPTTKHGPATQVIENGPGPATT